MSWEIAQLAYPLDLRYIEGDDFAFSITSADVTVSTATLSTVIDLPADVTAAFVEEAITDGVRLTPPPLPVGRYRWWAELDGISLAGGALNVVRPGSTGRTTPNGVTFLITRDDVTLNVIAGLAPVDGSGIVDSIVAGANVTVDDTDPANPVVSASGGGGGAVDSVNGATGVVELDFTDVGADEAGSAAVVASDLAELGYNVRKYGATGFGVTDDSDAVNAAIQAAFAGGGGTVIFPPGRYRVDELIIPNDGEVVPTQPTIRLLGAGSFASGTQTDLNGAAILDLRATSGIGRLDTRGHGLLVIEDLVFHDTVDSTVPFIYTTNTTLHVRGNAFVGHSSRIRETCVQDAILCGGTSNVHGTLADDAPFQGYGTIIEGNYFDRIRRGVHGRVFFNGVVIADNTAWATCGADNTAGWLQSTGYSNSVANTGLYVVGNLIEGVGYVYPFRSTRTYNSYYANSIYDADAGFGACYLFEADSLYNFVQDVYRPDSHPLVLETGNAVGTNSWVTAHQSQASVQTQPWRFTNIGSGVEFAGFVQFTGGASRFQVQPAASQINEGVELFRVRRSAAEASNPNATVASLQQGGRLVLGGVSSAVRFQDQAGSSLAFIERGAGSPEGAITAPAGSLYLRYSGTPALWIKATGAGNTGWVVVNPSAAGGQVDEITAGTGIAVDPTDPTDPVVSLDAAALVSLGKADTALQAGEVADTFVHVYTDEDEAHSSHAVDLWIADPPTLPDPTNLGVGEVVLRDRGIEAWPFALSDETTALTTGQKISYRAPFAMQIVGVRACLTTASSFGAVTVDVEEGGVSIFSTPITIDQGETTTTTAVTPAVISDGAIADDAVLTFDVDGAGADATGLKVTLLAVRV